MQNFHRAMLIGVAFAVASLSTSVAAAPRETVIVLGGLRVDKHTPYVETAADRATPSLPVVYENKDAAKPALSSDNQEPVKKGS